jgi:hypothetical protein
VFSRSVRWALVVALLAATALRASTPPLPLPPWVDIELSSDQAPELRRPVTFHATVKALLAKDAQARYAFTLPDGLAVRAGSKSGVLNLEPDRAVTVDLTVEVTKPLFGASVTLDVTSHPPKARMREEVMQAFSDKAYRDRAVSLVNGLPAESVLTRILGFSTSAAEGTFATDADPAYRRYVSLHDQQATFPVLDAEPGSTLGTVNQQLKTDVARLVVFKRLVATGAKDPIPRMTADLERTVARLRYQEAVFHLVAGQAQQALAILEAPALTGAQLAPSMETARRIAVAVALVMKGEPSRARTALEGLLAKGIGRTARYVHFALGEILRLGGDRNGAARHYDAALKSAPSYSAARARLEENANRR